MTNSPGNGLKFESAPFKLTNEFVRVMGGIQSEGFKRFRMSMIEGYYAIH